jgi:hypothetical protein
MKTNDLLHYVIVYGVLLAAWIPLMDFFGGNVAYTAVAGFAVFIVADKMAHKALGV